MYSKLDCLMLNNKQKSKKKNPRDVLTFEHYKVLLCLYNHVLGNHFCYKKEIVELIVLI